jgi:hypothetical protein
MKVVLNNVYGGYGLSRDIITMYLERINTLYRIGYICGEYYDHDCVVVDGDIFDYNCIRRDDPVLIEILEEVGYINKGLKIVIVPDFASYSIGEYDGTEWIQETWITVTADELRAGLSEERLEQASQVDCIKIRQ